MRSGHRMENTQFRTLLLAGLVERLEAFGLVGALERATALNDGPSPPGRETSADPEHGADGGIQEQWTRIVKALFDYEPPREIKDEILTFVAKSLQDSPADALQENLSFVRSLLPAATRRDETLKAKTEVLTDLFEDRPLHKPGLYSPEGPGGLSTGAGIRNPL